MSPPNFMRQLVQVKRGLQQPVIEVGNLKPRRAFLDVSDAARGVVLLAQGKWGGVYSLCVAITYEIGQLLRAAINLSSVTVRTRTSSLLMRS